MTESEEIAPITSPEEHKIALAEVDRLILQNPQPGTGDQERLVRLGEVVEAYERVHFPTPIRNEWCWSVDEEVWHTTSTREEAISAAKEDRAQRAEHNPGRAQSSKVIVGQCRWFTHDKLVSGLGYTVRERLADFACDLVGDSADDYPDMSAAPFDAALEAFVLTWLKEHAGQPQFYEVLDEEEVDLDKETE